MGRWALSTLSSGVALVAAAALLLGSAADDSILSVRPAHTSANPEQPLVDSFFELGRGRVDAALGNLGTLVSRQPDFTLARLVYADLLAIKSGRIEDLGLLSGGEQVAGLRHEARARLARYLEAPPVEARPAELVQLAGGRSVILVDVARFRLYLF